MSMTMVFVGIDLAKSVFALHGVDEVGKPALVRPLVRRDRLLEMVAKLPPCTIGMEAGSGAHCWARQFVAFGHTIRLIAPKFVMPYRISGKQQLGRITKSGDAYLRTLLILGARAVLAAAANKIDRISRWAITLAERRGYWKAVVAIAAKNARMAWAMLAKGENFKPIA